MGTHDSNRCPRFAAVQRLMLAVPLTAQRPSSLAGHLVVVVVLPSMHETASSAAALAAPVPSLVLMP
jgi:hypothetical protein